MAHKCPVKPQVTCAYSQRYNVVCLFLRDIGDCTFKDQHPPTDDVILRAVHRLQEGCTDQEDPLT
jgi:hypothetical protein